MKQKSLALLLKLVVVGIGVCALLFYLFFLPAVGYIIVKVYPEYRDFYWPWFSFCLSTAIPVYIILFHFWFLFEAIRNNESFTRINGKRLHIVSRMFLLEILILLVGNILMIFIATNRLGVILMFTMIGFLCMGCSAAAKMLSQLVYQAADMKEENSLTI